MSRELCRERQIKRARAREVQGRLEGATGAEQRGEVAAASAECLPVNPVAARRRRGHDEDDDSSVDMAALGEALGQREEEEAAEAMTDRKRDINMPTSSPNGPFSR